MAQTSDATPATVPPPSRMGRQRVWRYVVPLLLCAVALLRVYRTPYSAANLDFPPDAQEYVLGAQRLVLLGSYSIEIEGISYPPRYPPWFSVFVLAPFYLVAPHSLGIGIIPVTLSALVAVMAAYALGRRISGVWGGALAGVFLLLDESFVFQSRLIVTDTVVVALLLVLTMVLLRLRRSASARWYWLAGIIVALAGSMRVLAYSGVMLLVAQVLLQRRQWIGRIIAVSLPAMVMILATAVYNHHVFGDWRRSGYHFWTPIPYDYPELTFSLDYLGMNLRALQPAWWVGVVGAVGAMAMWRWRPRRARSVMMVVLLVGLPISLLHLVYFFAQARFHLPLIALLCVVGGGGLGLLVPHRLRRHAWLAMIPVLLIARPGHQLYPELAGEPGRYLAAQQMATTEPNAVIITSIDPVYLEPLVLRGTQRRIIPLSRDTEYASKAVAWEKIALLDPPPVSPYDHRAEGLLRGGAKDVVPFTADEAPQAIVELHRQGVPIYLFVDPAHPSARMMITLFQLLERPVGLPDAPPPP